MDKFKKTLRIIVAVIALTGAVYAVTSTSIPTVVYGCDSGCD
jgi:hypothetical protein